MRYWDDLSLTQLLMGRIGHPKKHRLACRVACVGFNSKSEDCAKVSAYRPDYLLQEQLGV